MAQFTAKTTNSEQAMYFLSLMSCAIIKLKSRMFFTCKKLVFSDFTRKKNFCSWKWGGGWRGGGLVLFFIIIPVNSLKNNKKLMNNLYLKHIQWKFSDYLEFSFLDFPEFLLFEKENVIYFSQVPHVYDHIVRYHRFPWWSFW